MRAALLDVRGVAERLGVSPYTARRLIGAGRLRAYRVGRQLRVEPADVEAFLASHVLDTSDPLQDGPDGEDRDVGAASGY